MGFPLQSRGVYETPGGTILLEAHRGMESICLDRCEMHLKVISGFRISSASAAVTQCWLPHLQALLIVPLAYAAPRIK